MVLKVKFTNLQFNFYFMRPVNFNNFTSEDFSHLLGGERWDFPKGKTMILEAEKACHFAKHLVDRELMKIGKQVSDPQKHVLIKKISSDLMFDPRRKHQVIIDPEGRVNPVIPGSDAMQPKVKVATEKPLSEMTRAELEKEAAKLSIPADSVSKADSNKALVNLIEGVQAGLKPKKQEAAVTTPANNKDGKPSEKDFEGLK